MPILLAVDRQDFTFLNVWLQLLLSGCLKRRRHLCMECKDSGGMPSPGTGSVSGAESVSVLPQRNGATPSEMCPSSVSRTLSSGSGSLSAMPQRNGGTPAEVCSTPASRTISLSSGPCPGPLNALPERNGSPPAELCSAPFPGILSLGVHTPAADMFDSSTPGSTGLVVDVSSTPSHPSPLHTCDMLTAIVPHSTSASISGVISIAKRKRGRPRKYAPDGSMGLAITPLATIPSCFPHSKQRGRGRPPGSGKKQQLAALGELMITSAGAGFTPHAITIAAGEDVATKIMSFSQHGPRGICILSANGAISNVTLQQSATSGGTVTYEGRFEILSLSGSFLLTESGGVRTRTGGLSVSLAGPDGKVVGGGVAGLLVAASPVQVIVGSFISNTRKPQVRPPKVVGSTGLPPVSASHSPTADIPVVRSPEKQIPDIKPVVAECPPLNQLIVAVANSNAQPPQSQPIMIPLVWSASQIMPEAMRNSGIVISSP